MNAYSVFILLCMMIMSLMSDNDAASIFTQEDSHRVKRWGGYPGYPGYRGWGRPWGAGYGGWGRRWGYGYGGWGR
ncbi:hypothetical protein AB6A40_000338 [Gnathostoma spinigerum]|uniref:Glycine-rich protein n=1 Tax=Gnathostoma spinigerum TaxID=75299 RepID=A0ABD6E682_9BILA